MDENIRRLIEAAEALLANITCGSKHTDPPRFVKPRWEEITKLEFAILHAQAAAEVKH